MQITDWYKFIVHVVQQVNNSPMQRSYGRDIIPQLSHAFLPQHRSTKVTPREDRVDLLVPFDSVICYLRTSFHRTAMFHRNCHVIRHVVLC